MIPEGIGAFVLAAGFSSRMGDFKPLMDLEGRTLLEWAVTAFRRAGVRAITVVTGHRNEEVGQEARRLGVPWVQNPDPGRGMFSSVCVAAEAARGLDAFFLLPVDIPLVRPATVQALVAARNAMSGNAGRTVLYPTHDGRRGHPPLIPGALVPAILDHDGQGGLKTLLERFPGQDVPVWDRGVLLDADTGDDFALLRRKARRLHIGEAGELRALSELLMPWRGVAHGRAVARVAVRLGEALNAHGHDLDLELLHNAALVHDIAKGLKQHEQRGGEMLAALGLDGLSDIVASHRVVPPPASGRLTEKEVVCLADKLVRGPRRVDVRARFQEKLDQYWDDPEACAAIRSRMDKALGLQEMVERITGSEIDGILAGVLS